jgi:anti-sigma B factor antagonist
VLLTLPTEDHSPATLSVHVEDSGGCALRVCAAGELDLTGSPILKAALSIAQACSPLVVLDLRGLTFCDSSGVHAVVDADERARDTGELLIVIPAPQVPHRVFELTGTALQLADLTPRRA